MAEKWFKEAVEAKPPFDLGGWHKDQKESLRRRFALKSRDNRLSKHDQFISAGRALQALANVTKDEATRKAAGVDAEYFFKRGQKSKPDNWKLKSEGLE